MGNRGKVAERAEARKLRAEGLRYDEIAAALEVSKSSVSRWCRDVPIPPQRLRRRRPPRRRPPNRLQRAKAADLDAAETWARERLPRLDDVAFLAAGVALYAGDGAKTDGVVKFSNSNPDLIAFFCRWFRHHFQPDERRMRVRVYLHDGLDLAAAEAHWARVTGVPVDQFHRAHIARPTHAASTTKHVHGCCHVIYSCSTTHRKVMAAMRRLVHSPDLPG